MIALPATSWFVELVQQTPPSLLVAAAVAAAIPCALVCSFDRQKHDPWSLCAAAFFWGAVVAAFYSKLGNDMLLLQLGGLVGEARSKVWMGRVGGPLVEEVMKLSGVAVALALAPRARRGARAVMVLGGLSGLGFAMSENATYFLLAAVQGGTNGLLRSIYLRAVLGGLNHATFTALGAALIGAGCVAPEQRRNAPFVVAGIVAAIGAHIVWNAVAAPQLNDALCAAVAAGAVCLPEPPLSALLVAAPLIIAIGVGPAILLLVAVVRSSERRSPLA